VVIRLPIHSNGKCYVLTFLHFYFFSFLFFNFSLKPNSGDQDQNWRKDNLYLEGIETKSK